MGEEREGVWSSKRVRSRRNRGNYATMHDISIEKKG